jgi:fucose permease
MLFVPFPWAWVLCFFAVSFLFMNIGPANTAIANVTDPAVRSTAFALNIFVIHALGDAISPPLIGAVADRSSLTAGFFVVSLAMFVAGVIWLFAARYLGRDTLRVREDFASA